LDDSVAQAAQQANVGAQVLDERDAFAGHDFCTRQEPFANRLRLNLAGVRNLVAAHPVCLVAKGPLTAMCLLGVGVDPMALIDHESYHPTVAGYHKLANDLAAFLAPPQQTTTSTSTTTTVPQKPSGLPFRVSHVAGNGLDGLAVQTGPAMSFAQAGGSSAPLWLHDGDLILVACQVQGGPVTGRGGTSVIWDQLTDGFYVSDYYTDTPGGLSWSDKVIPRCSGTPPVAPQSYPYAVAHTVGNGLSGLPEQLHPDAGAPQAGGSSPLWLHDGDRIDIVCQVQGGQVTGKAGPSTIWDKLTNGFYVSDDYTTTPGWLTWSAGIPRC
jgi:hypothetical protein